MDRRVLKSRQSIINAFIEIRRNRDLEKITVIELCRKAEINKSTFYVHYHDVYDLSAQLETELVESLIDSIEQPEIAFDEPETFTMNLFRAFNSKKHLINIIFSGSRSSALPEKVEKIIKSHLFGLKPEYRDDPKKNIEFTYMIYGAFYSFLINTQDNKYDEEEVINTLCSMVGNAAELKKNG